MWPKNQNKYFSSQTLVRWTLLDGLAAMKGLNTCMMIDFMSKLYLVYTTLTCSEEKRFFAWCCWSNLQNGNIRNQSNERFHTTEDYCKMRQRKRDREFLWGGEDVHFTDMLRRFIPWVWVWEQDYRQDIPLMSSGSRRTFWDAFEQAED